MAAKLWIKDGKLVLCADGKLALQETCPCDSAPVTDCALCPNQLTFTVSGFAPITNPPYSAIVVSGTFHSTPHSACTWVYTGSPLIYSLIWTGSVWEFTIETPGSILEASGALANLTGCPPLYIEDARQFTLIGSDRLLGQTGYAQLEPYP